jgi:hypothetical protein
MAVSFFILTFGLHYLEELSSASRANAFKKNLLNIIHLTLEVVIVAS